MAKLARLADELAGKTTTNKSPRFLPIYGGMKPEIEMAVSLADAGCPFLIQRDGDRVSSWMKPWKRACRLARIDDALFDDLRRTALTNMIEAGFERRLRMLPGDSRVTSKRRNSFWDQTLVSDNPQDELTL
jgi:hypothetical protein